MRHGRGPGIDDFGRTSAQRKQAAELGAKGKESTVFHFDVSCVDGLHD
ncbi:hypothetical protein ESCNG_50087 [Neisseria gonorrhoeae]|nr:hypothetical protein ESCNG_50087 [Neisseria gonorrhoeae]